MCICVDGWFLGLYDGKHSIHTHTRVDEFCGCFCRIDENIRGGVLLGRDGQLRMGICT